MKQILINIFHHMVTRKLVIVKWQFDLMAILLVIGGFMLGSLISWNFIIPQIFAASTWSQTNWDGGVGASTTTQYASASNIDATTTSGEVVLATTEKLSNTGFESDLSSWVFSAITASGGTVATGSGYTTHTFTGSGTFTSNSSGSVDYLVVGGGGGGGAAYGGGGGAGGMLTGSTSVTAQAYSITVGAGGNGSPAVNVQNVGSNGGNSGFSTVTAYGGGGGAGYLPRGGKSGGDGASGGGGVFEGTGGNGTSGQGYNGGAASTYPYVGGGGGGGAGAAGDNGTSAAGGNGGAGVASSISGSSVTYAGGGGGGTYQGGPGGAGGAGGGGAGASGVANNAGSAGTNGTGGGGGGSSYLNNTLAGGNGGSGVVIVRYPTLTVTRDTGIKYAGTSSAKLVNGTTVQNFTQTINVGDTNSYSLVAYAYTDGSAVSSSDVELYYNSATVTTTYTSVGAGWYKLSGTITGANASRVYGVQVKVNKTVYVDGISVSSYASSGTLTSNIFDTGQLSSWGNATYTSSGSTITVKIRSSNSATMVGATAFSSCTVITSGTDISSNNCMTDGQRYVQYQVALSTADTSSSPTFSDISIDYSAYDTVAPPTNASSLAMSTASSGGRVVSSNGWNNATSPYFSWTAGADDVDGSGILGYCLYLGTDSAGNPATAKGILGTSPVSIPSGSTCQFIVSSSSIDLSTSGYLGSALVSGTTYYLNVKAIDVAGNTFTGSAASFHFQHDGTAPTNVSYLSMPSQNYSNVSDMNFSWPTTGTGVATDSASGVVGWQYQINSSSGTWQGTTHHATLDLDYIPATASAYTLVPARDSSAIVSGNNVVYFRTVDSAGNPSASSTYRTGNLTYGGAAPSFDGDGTVTISPSSSSTNSFALSWPAATASGSNTVTHYYYMINTSPPSTLATLQGNSTTYIDNGTSRTVSADALANVNKGSNTVYVVAIDNAGTPNYSPSNAISGTFTLNSTNPDPVQSLVATDSSIKAQSQWNVTLTWTAGSYQGAGNLTYLVYRSADNSSFSEVGSTSGLSYVDNTPSSAPYYYYVVTQDGANATSASSSTVTITPTGKYTTPPSLSSGPTVSLITTKGATITWSTDRAGDSRVAYGTSSGSYFATQPSVATQVTAHSIALTNLIPGTTYYYTTNWTDVDGNIGTSSEKTFSTSPAPKVQDVKTTRIGLSDATIQFTSVGASSVKIYYGGSTAFGAVDSLSTGTGTTTYTAELSDLIDGKKYYYQINTFDADGNEYVGTILDFTTLPRPKISGVRVQQVSNTAQPTILVSWNTNTLVSSIVTYYPEGNTAGAKDEVNVALTKGEHQMIIRSLFPQTNYYLLVKGRDKAGNEAVSDLQKVTTATDTRPPQVSGLKVEGSSTPTSRNSQDQQSQLSVSWNTDEPSSSQVEFGEGTGSVYSQKTQEDSTLNSNHLVVISGLTPSKVYHLRVVSKDKAANIGNSIDTVTITPKATDNAFNLVVGSLGQIFGGFGK